eukprot:CAMPEP_0173103896 /NCGR_PEP_ID=MMETSP1102-20130122/38745_1 /TAXON_ID=49646 /ORGANISM="Geminigera sp., Strain Caron Lab Isolate" /LENGTH=261 /DNA_ID=CAMNT_0013998963 /DNA_START=28 /DNA_END=814 /DNA_ORIENTATION=-
MSLGTQADAAQPLLYNIYKLNKWSYKPDNRQTYERSLNDHLRPGPVGRPRSMYARMENSQSSGMLPSTPRPMTMLQSRPSSAHQLAMTGMRMQLLTQSTVYPRSGSDQPVHEPLPVCTPRRALLDSRRERERLALQLSHRDTNQGDTYARSPRQHQSAAGSGAAPFALTAALQKRLQTLEEPRRFAKRQSAGSMTHRDMPHDKTEGTDNQIGFRGAALTSRAAIQMHNDAAAHVLADAAELLRFGTRKGSLLLLAQGICDL